MTTRVRRCARLAPPLTTLEVPLLPRTRPLYGITGGLHGCRLEATLEISAEGVLKATLTALGAGGFYLFLGHLDGCAVFGRTARGRHTYICVEVHERVRLSCIWGRGWRFVVFEWWSHFRQPGCRPTPKRCRPHGATRSRPSGAMGEIFWIPIPLTAAEAGTAAAEPRSAPSAVNDEQFVHRLTVDI